MRGDVNTDADADADAGSRREEKGRTKNEERSAESGRTCDAHSENLPAVHELIQLHGLEEPELLQVFTRLPLVLLQQFLVRQQRGDALVEAYLRLLRPLGRFCMPQTTSTSTQQREACQ